MTFQRILTYTLSSITKKIVQVLFLAVGLVITGHAILTPMLMVIIMLTGDFLGMSLTTDNVSPSPLSNAWANRQPDECYSFSSSNRLFASFRSAVSKPSGNHP